MRKVLDKDLEKKIADLKDAGAIVEFLRKFQDASGLKVCQNVSRDDPAYKEIE